MSWDIFVQDLPQNAQSIYDIPDDFTPKPLGNRTAIVAKIQEIVPFADFSNPAYGTIEAPNFLMDINLGSSENVEHFLISVWGGETAVATVADILRYLEMRALDPSSETGIFAADASQAGYRAWSAFRNHIVGG